MSENQDHFMIRLMRRCEADLWYSIPMLVCVLSLFLSTFAPEPWQTWAVVVGVASLVVVLIAVFCNVGKERAGKKISKNRYPIIGRLDGVLFVAWLVVGFLTIIWSIWIAPLLK